MREAKTASHVLQTVWSYKELRGALQRDGWTKARFQVQPPCPLSHFATLIPSRSFLGLTSSLCFLTQSASTAKGPKGTPSSGGFDDGTLPLVDRSLGEHKQGTGA